MIQVINTQSGLAVDTKVTLVRPMAFISHNEAANLLIEADMDMGTVNPWRVEFAKANGSRRVKYFRNKPDATRFLTWARLENADVLNAKASVMLSLNTRLG